MCHLMAGSQEAVKYTKLLLEDVKKAPKSEGLHILWMHMMPFLQEPVKDIFNYSDQIHISACDFVADGFQKTHYEDPYESMAEKMVNWHLQWKRQAENPEGKRACGADKCGWRNPFYTLGMQRYDRSFQSDQRIA